MRCGDAKHGARTACGVSGATVDAHGCAVVSCTGYPCDPNHFCNNYGNYFYCDVKPCSTDGDCDCGVCLYASATVQGTCAGRLNICVRGMGGAQGSSGGNFGSGGIRGSGGVTGQGGAIDGGYGIDGTRGIDGG